MSCSVRHWELELGGLGSTRDEGVVGIVIWDDKGKSEGEQGLGDVGMTGA